MMSLENAFIEQLAQYIEINYKEYLPVTDENILYEKYAPLSKNVLYSEFFSVVLGNSEEKKGMPLPGGCYLVADTKESLSRRMEKDDHFVRAYSKNEMYTGKHIETRWQKKFWDGKI